MAVVADLDGDILKMLFLALMVRLGLLSSSEDPSEPELAKFFANDSRFPIKIVLIIFSGLVNDY